MIDIENITDELDVISYEEFLKTEEDILFKIRNKAESLMSLNGLYDWKFQFDNAQTRFGFCSHSHNIISISKKIALVVSFEEVVDSIESGKVLDIIENPNLKKYCEGMRSFVLNIRNCIRMRTSMLGNLETESTRIRIDQWTEMKVKFSNEKPKEELLMIASKLIDEVFIHLSEILLDITSSKKNYKERK